MARRTSPRKVTYFEPVLPRLARNTIIESTFDCVWPSRASGAKPTNSQKGILACAALTVIN